MAPVALSILSELTRRLDRNGNNRLESYEARVRGRIGNRNGVIGTQEAASSVHRGDAVLEDFRLAPVDARNLARRIAGYDGVVSRDELFVSSAARVQIERRTWERGAYRDGVVTEGELAEALCDGQIAITREGVFLPHEVSGHDRPTPPPIDPRPFPPPIDPRPFPPVDPRPFPPPVDPRPVPPPIDPGWPGYARSPRDVIADFRRRHGDLKAIYNNSPMTQAEFRRLEREIWERAADDLIRAYGYPFAERNTALNTLYNSTGMTSEEHRNLQRRLWTDEAEQILGRTHQPFSERSGPLKELYNSTSMTSEEFRQLERRLIDQEVDRIIWLPAPLTEKTNLLNRLYNGSSMTATERDAAWRRIMESEYGYRR